MRTLRLTLTALVWLTLPAARAAADLLPSRPITFGDGRVVGEAAAKKAAAPVLKAVGQDDAKLDASQIMGDRRVVNADPEVGGLPTYGWTTGVVVGATGGVGSLAVQLVALAGATVIAPALPDDDAFLRDLGVGELLDREGDVAAAVRERHPDGVEA